MGKRIRVCLSHCVFSFTLTERQLQIISTGDRRCNLIIGHPDFQPVYCSVFLSTAEPIREFEGPDSAAAPVSKQRADFEAPDDSNRRPAVVNQHYKHAQSNHLQAEVEHGPSSCQGSSCKVGTLTPEPEKSGETCNVLPV